MRHYPSTHAVLACLAMAGALALSGCSKDKSTNPTATAKELNSGDIVNGATYAHRFFSAGTFNYHCARHSTMPHASVTVSDAAAAGDTLETPTISGFAFHPDTFTIHTGGKVTWTNQDGATHTVTSD